MLIDMRQRRRCVLMFTVVVTLFLLAAPSMGQQASDSDVPSDYADTDPSAVEVFREELAPYGMWVEDPDYGLVWIPSVEVVGPEFIPYMSAGYWGVTEQGDWIWVSDYTWGWAVFHYGRWVWIPQRGWAWIPGRTYAPAWVVWRVGEPGYDYIGWAPMPPSYYWYGGVAVSLWVIPPPYYVYCETRYVFAPHVHSHRLSGYRAHEASRHTRPHRPASPSLRTDRHAARPHRSPTMEQARVPADAVPRTPATAHPRLATSRSSQPSASRLTTAPSTTSGVPRARPSSSLAAVSQPVYGGMPSNALPTNRRASPLAARPMQPSASYGRMVVSRSSRTLGSSSAPSSLGARPIIPRTDGHRPSAYDGQRRGDPGMVRGHSMDRGSSSRPSYSQPGSTSSVGSRSSGAVTPRPQPSRVSGSMHPVRESTGGSSMRSSMSPSYRAPAASPAPAPTGTTNNTYKQGGSSKGRGSVSGHGPRGGRR